MSIRLKILAGCLSLTFITVLIGSFTLRSQQELGTITTRIYDEAFTAVSYLREAQIDLMKVRVAFANSVGRDVGNAAQSLSGGKAHALLATTIPSILSDLQAAHDKAMSPAGDLVAASLRQQIARLPSGPEGLLPDVVPDLTQIQATFDRLMRIYADDGLRFRRGVGLTIAQSTQRTWIAIGLSVLVAMTITLLLSRSIVPALRDAVRIAKAIASGQLDNTIAARGRGETGQLLRSLAVMQTSISVLMAEQASNHAGEIAIQNGRFEAALNNMTQGLCLFDACGHLSVFNRRFAEMFGTPALGASAESIVMGDGVKGLFRQSESTYFAHDLPDGRVIAVTHRPIEGGGWVATYDDVTERRRVEARFAYMARHDALTGLPNRVLFHERMEHLLAHLGGKSLAVLSLDLDGFKAINDTLGHPVGDALLQAVGTRLQECKADTDIVARLGGDEFAVILEETSQPGDVQMLAQRLVKAMSLPFEIDTHHIIIGASVGIATTKDIGNLTSADTFTVLLKNADTALYRAKGDGRGTYRFFDAEMDSRLQARRTLDLDLRTAFEKAQFEVFYQPLVDSKRRKVSGFEALLRWHHPDRGMISPAEFIPVAEETGLIKAIGAWVLEQACTEAAKWPDGIKVAVNLSPVQFRNSDLVAVVSGALTKSGLEANRLELEITESLLLDDNRTVLKTLHQLRHLGVSISMDDFGTGYSSLSYLQRFPFDKIKIDQSFIRELSEKPDCVAIVRAIISLGRSLGMAIIAEGVETAEQLAVLQIEGCWDVQGYFFSPPKPASHALGLIESYHVSQRGGH